MGYDFEELSGKVIAAAIAVHRSLGPGFMESIYEESLRFELADRGIPVESQKQIKVLYRDKMVGLHVLDLLVDGALIIELKAVKSFDDVHFAQLRSYLKATGVKVGLLMNFNNTRLSVRRVVLKNAG
ncbi:MAG: GxxExxY protein [Armatimonadetes bacterium]|nr:GxxExxY protein [Armatimonadota bacterium]